MLTCTNYDNSIRWREGERLADLFERRCDTLVAAGKKNHAAVICEDEDRVITYTELDGLANQAARYLLARDIRPGDRVGLLFDNPIYTYIALLAVVKINAAYVPLDPGFPADRMGFIIDDANIKTLVTLSHFRFQLNQFPIPKLVLDLDKDIISEQDNSRLTEVETGPVLDQLCYIIYTSGSTGRPKGVAVEQPSICNFVEVAREVYGITDCDRVYQGMTIAFDFSVEELWVPLIAGATLIPGTSETKLVGRDLSDFLHKHRVTALCCVPTLLATIDEDLPLLRFLLVSGEACPQDLVVRWHRPGRTIINAYGPTEATVTATAVTLHPDKPVTIGQPLPTYSIVILDQSENHMVPEGELGEICIAGIGLAKGYVNREELTCKRFIPDFLTISNNPSGRLYRTGDLGCINAEGEIEYHGRIDEQVKVRGYRIELTEIESVLLQLPNIAQAVVNVCEPEPGLKELAAYYTLKNSEPDATSAREIAQALRKQLPGYMVPVYYQKMDCIPMLPSNKADRKKLPAPEGPRLVAASGTYVAPRNSVELTVAKTLAETLGLEQVSINDNFFSELGAHSLLMARFCAALREEIATPVSMREVYVYPSVAQLAGYIQGVLNEGTAETDKSQQIPPLRVASNVEYYTCGALQILYYAALFYLGFSLMVYSITWVAGGATPIDYYQRTSLAMVALFLFSCALPIAVKWLVIGRWKPEVIPIWSLKYFRFWAVKLLIQSSPLVMFRGQPLYNVYLRLLGAKIGRNVVIESSATPVCTDLLSIGDNVVLSKDSLLFGYRAVSNVIYTGSISIGSNTFIGEASVLEIDSVMEDGTQLGHCSSLCAGQRLASGKHYHGSPAVETSTQYCTVEPRHCSLLRKIIYSSLPLCSMFLIAPASILAILYLALFAAEHHLALPTELSAYSEFSLAVAYKILVFSSYIFIATLFIGLATVAALPRLLSLLIKENRVYVLYGVRYWVFKAIKGVSNSKFYNLLFGDSSYIVYYLQFIGYNLSKVVQTGSNFGVSQKHDSPLLCNIGTNTMVADGLSMMNAEISSTSFRLSSVTIGDNNFLGNSVHYPAQGKTGNNCLLATKVMIPIDGPVRENTGLLGAPCFEIPRSSCRDASVATLDERTRQRRLKQKNKYNLATMALFLLVRWVYMSISLIIFYYFITHFLDHGLITGIILFVLFPLFTIGYFVLVERASLRFRRMKPQIVSIYDLRFWQVERYWKLSEDRVVGLFKGTPFKNIITRLLGVKIGKKVFDDGCGMSEKTLVEIGDYCTLNERSFLQSHSLEEGVFKSDFITLDKGCTVGTDALVHYGVKANESVVIDAESFVMKGEVAKPHTRWRGNPAKMV